MDKLSAEKLGVMQLFDDTPFLGPQGQMDARMVFTHTLFFSNAAKAEGQKRAVETLGLLAQDIADKIAVMELPTGGLVPWNARRFQDDSFARIDQAFARRPDQRDLDLAFHGQTDGTLSAFGGSLTITPPLMEGEADLSFLEASTSLMWDAPLMFQRQIARMQAAASRLKPVFGLAGMGLLFDRSGPSTSSVARLVPVMKRFPGVHCGLNAAFAVEAALRRPTPDRYFSVNWLTAVSDALLAQLSPDALKSLPESCVLHPYDGGKIIQAGPHPQPGDANRGFVLHDYRAVQAVLAPVQFDGYRVGILPVPAPRDSLYETLEWTRRFD